MEAHFKTARTLTIAMMATVFLCGVIALTMKGQGYEATSEAKMNFLRLIVSIVALVQIMLAYAMYTMMKGLTDKKRLVTLQIMVNAFCEAIAIFGFILFFISKNFMDFAAFAVISLGAFTFFFPRRAKWITDAIHPNRGI